MNIKKARKILLKDPEFKKEYEKLDRELERFKKRKGGKSKKKIV